MSEANRARSVGPAQKITDIIDDVIECARISSTSKHRPVCPPLAKHRSAFYFHHEPFPNGRTDWQWAPSQIRASKEWIMTDRNQLHTLRTYAKHLARASRIPHHQALDIVATRCGHPHWNALTAAWAKGWRPTTGQLVLLRKPHATDAPLRGVGLVSASEGVIAGEPYELEVGFDDVLIGGRGWAISLGHAPSEAAEIERYTSPNPLDNERSSRK